MRLINILETPLSDMGEISRNPKDASFRPEDRRAIDQYMGLKRYKIENLFKNTPYDFKIYFRDNNTNPMEIDKDHRHLYNPYDNPYAVMKDHNDNILDIDLYRAVNIAIGYENTNDPQHIKQLDRLRDSTAIVVVLTNNEGDNRVGLTTWMIAHRISHGLLHSKMDGQLSNILKKLNNQFQELLTDMCQDLNRIKISIDPFYPDISNLESIINRLIIFSNTICKSPFYIFSYFGNTRALREKSFKINYGEIMVELLSQYIVKGSIEVQELPYEKYLKELDWSKYSKYEYAHNHYMQLIEKTKQIYVEINKCLDSILKNSVGKIFVI